MDRFNYSCSAEDVLFIIACAALSVAARHQPDGPPRGEPIAFARFMRSHSTSRNPAIVALRRAFKTAEDKTWTPEAWGGFDRALCGALLYRSAFYTRISKLEFKEAA